MDNHLKENDMGNKVNTLNYNNVYIIVTREEMSDSTDRRTYQMTNFDSLYRYCISIDDENGGQEQISTHPDKFLALEAASIYSHKYSLPVMDATE